MANISIPYSFTTDKTGVHKLELFRIGSGTPVSVISKNIQVTNIAILQTGTITLDSLDSDNYKLYIYKLLDNGDNECIASSNTTLLTCSGNPLNCTKPTFDVFITSPSCNSGLQNNDGSIVISNVIGGQKTRLCLGQVWNCSTDYNAATDITNTNLFTVANDIAVTNSQPYDYYVVRVYKDPICYLDKVVKLTKPSCVSDFCALEEVYNGQATDKKYYYKNETSAAKTIAIRLEPTTPVDLRIVKNNLTVYSTECAGLDITSCSSCVQGGVICGQIVLQPQDILELSIDSTCSTNAITSWKLKTSCSSLPECISSITFGQNNVCGLTLPSNGIKFTCNSATSLVDLEVSNYYGGISNEYQFGYDVNNVWQTSNDVVWENSNRKISLPKDKAINIWVRDKNNTTCSTVFNTRTPNCINVNPKLKQPTLQQFFNQTGNTLTVDATDIVTTDNYEASYKYLDENYSRPGTFNKSTSKLTLPLSARQGTVEITLKDTTIGAVSNKVYSNIIESEVLFIGTLSNICQPGTTDTFVNFSYNKIDALLPYVVVIRDALTSAVLYTQEVTDPTNIKIRHTEVETPVVIQAYSKGNSLRGSQQTGATLVRQTCGNSSTSCCIEKVAYSANVIGSGSQVDSIGLYYKANCANGYRIYIESETNRGVYELYNTVATAVSGTYNAPYDSFNYRIIQALATRVWRGKNYKVKVEFTNPATGAIVDTAEFVVDLTANTAVNTPFTKFTCNTTGGGGNSSCGLVDGTDYGDWSNGTFDVISKYISGRWIIATADKAYADTTKRFYPRGINFADSTNIVYSKTLPRSCFDQTQTGFGGLVAPTGLTAPDGYIPGTTQDNSLYFELGTSQPTYPCNQACDVYTGIIPSQANGGYYTKLIYERKKPSLGTAAGSVTNFLTKEDAIRYMAAFAVDQNAVDQNGYLAAMDFVTTVKNNNYTQFFNVGDYLLNNNIPPYDLGIAQCGFITAPTFKPDNTTYPITEQYRILTINPCGNIINIENYVVNTGGGGGGGSTGGTMSAIAGPQPTFNGTINVAATRQNIPERMNLVVSQYANGRVSFNDASANDLPSDGRVMRYLIKEQTWVQSLAGLTFDPAFPILIEKFWVNQNAEQRLWKQPNNTRAFSFINID